MLEYLDILFNLPVKKHFTYAVEADTVCGPGYRVLAPLRNKDLRGMVVRRYQSRPQSGYDIKPITRVLDDQPLFDETLIELAEWTAKMYMCSPGEALSAMLPGGRRETFFDAGEEDSLDEPEEFQLAPQQTEAVKMILQDEHDFFYLYGVTGSGKTEVYLRAAETLMREGKGVLYLVPEISLTHQAVAAAARRFGDNVAVLHSGLTPSQRLKEWKRIQGGEARFVVGVRSGVFAPIQDIGLIIIDEEHEGSYKSGRTPRYHARQVAMKRCTQSGARLVMGSATPSVEAYHLMSTGRIKGIHLPERLSGGSMPSVEVVDMKREKNVLSRKLEAEIKQAVKEGHQAILFLNRRGFSYYFNCKSCGFEMTCSHCSVSLTYHKSRNKMICHYCGFSTPPVEVCPECGSLDVGYAGFGTEKIEEHIQTIFPHLTVKRLDTDTAGRKGVTKDILSSFKKGEIDILLGTQMVAKGLNFPNVKLVGIILADTGLQLPDFRAAERTFSLIVQVSGRAGRFLPDGKVIVQTFRPENEAIRYAVTRDVEKFFDRELDIRQALQFPPYSRLFRIVFRGRLKEVVQKEAATFSSLLRPHIEGKAVLLGPAECPLSMVSGNYRSQVIIRTTEFPRLHPILSGYIQDYEADRGVHLEVDVDPVNLL